VAELVREREALADGGLAAVDEQEHEAGPLDACAGDLGAEVEHDDLRAARPLDRVEQVRQRALEAVAHVDPRAAGHPHRLTADRAGHRPSMPPARAYAVQPSNSSSSPR